MAGVSTPLVERPVLDDPLGEARLLLRQHVGGGEATEDIEQDGDDARPSRLVAVTEPGAVVSVEVLVEENKTRQRGSPWNFAEQP